MFFARISTFAPNKLFHQKIYIMKRIITLICIVLVGMTGWAQNSDEKMDKEPLIVVNGEIFNVTQKFDFRNARNEDFAKLKAWNQMTSRTSQSSRMLLPQPSGVKEADGASSKSRPRAT